jgi:hypothetical protein
MLRPAFFRACRRLILVTTILWTLPARDTSMRAMFVVLLKLWDSLLKVTVLLLSPPSRTVLVRWLPLLSSSSLEASLLALRDS